MRLGRVRADDEQEAVVLDLRDRVGAGSSAERPDQAVESGSVSGRLARVDGVRPDPRARELLDEVVLLVRQARGREEADGLRAVLGDDLPEAGGRGLERVLPGRRVQLAVLAADERLREPVGWWTKLNAKRPLTQRLPSFGRYSSFEVTFTMCFVCGSRLRSIWQPTPQNVQVVRTCSSCALRGVSCPPRTSRRSRRSGRRRGSRRRARTRCRARRAPRSGRCARARRGPRGQGRALHDLLRVADAARAQDAGVRVVAHELVAVVVLLALRVGEDQRRLGAELVREVERARSGGRPAMRSGARRGASR